MQTRDTPLKHVKISNSLVINMTFKKIKNLFFRLPLLHKTTRLFDSDTKYDNIKISSLKRGLSLEKKK